MAPAPPVESESPVMMTPEPESMVEPMPAMVEPTPAMEEPIQPAYVSPSPMTGTNIDGIQNTETAVPTMAPETLPVQSAPVNEPVNSPIVATDNKSKMTLYLIIAIVVVVLEPLLTLLTIILCSLFSQACFGIIAYAKLLIVLYKGLLCPNNRSRTNNNQLQTKSSFWLITR